MLDYIDHIVTDEQKELYRFAAKAAGYDITFAISHANLLAGYTALIKTSNSEWRDWHPRENPTDALLLAAALKLHIIHNAPDDQVLWVEAGINHQDHWASSKFTDESLRPQNICRTIFFAAVSAGQAIEQTDSGTQTPTAPSNAQQ